MSTDKFQNKYRIQSARYPFHDYNAGLYFITICTDSMEHYFGEIIQYAPHRRDVIYGVSTGTNDVPTMENNESMDFSEIGKFADGCIKNIPVHFPNAEIPVYVIMPNHIHLIIAVNDNFINAPRTDANCRDAVYDVSTEQPTPQKPKPIKNEKMQNIANKCGTLSHIISNFKSAVTRYANQNNIPFKWQTRFYDHIIRDQNECNRIAEYIENNPYNWLQDKFYTE